MNQNKIVVRNTTRWLMLDVMSTAITFFGIGCALEKQMPLPSWLAFLMIVLGFVASTLLARLARHRASLDSEAADHEREQALDLLEKHGLVARYYMPGNGLGDDELASACHALGDRGYVITDARGVVVGGVISARPTADERASLRRQSFRLVTTD